MSAGDEVTIANEIDYNNGNATFYTIDADCDYEGFMERVNKALPDQPVIYVDFEFDEVLPSELANESGIEKCVFDAIEMNQLAEFLVWHNNTGNSDFSAFNIYCICLSDETSNLRLFYQECIYYGFNVHENENDDIAPFKQLAYAAIGWLSTDDLLKFFNKNCTGEGLQIVELCDKVWLLDSEA